MQYRDELLKEKKRNRSGQKIITFYAFSDMSSSSRQQCKVMLLKDICLSHDFASSIKSCRGNFNPCKLYVNKTDFFFQYFSLSRHHLHVIQSNSSPTRAGCLGPHCGGFQYLY